MDPGARPEQWPDSNAHDGDPLAMQYRHSGTTANGLFFDGHADNKSGNEYYGTGSEAGDNWEMWNPKYNDDVTNY